MKGFYRTQDTPLPLRVRRSSFLECEMRSTNPLPGQFKVCFVLGVFQYRSYLGHQDSETFVTGFSLTLARVLWEDLKGRSLIVNGPYAGGSGPLPVFSQPNYL